MQRHSLQVLLIFWEEEKVKEVEMHQTFSAAHVCRSGDCEMILYCYYGNSPERQYGYL